MEKLLVHCIIVFLLKDDQGDVWVTENAVISGHHISNELKLNFCIVSFIINFDEIGHFDPNLEIIARFYEILADSFGNFKIITTIMLF